MYKKRIKKILFVSCVLVAIREASGPYYARGGSMRKEKMWPRLSKGKLSHPGEPNFQLLKVASTAEITRWCSSVF